jgi:hypothetical protein
LNEIITSTNRTGGAGGGLTKMNSMKNDKQLFFENQSEMSQQHFSGKDLGVDEL